MRLASLNFWFLLLAVTNSLSSCLRATSTGDSVGGGGGGGGFRCPPKPHCSCRHMAEGLKVSCVGVGSSIDIESVASTVLAQLPPDTVKLSISSGMLQEFPRASLSNMTSLRSLYLSNNSISDLSRLLSSIPESIKCNITHLDLSNNRIRSIPVNMSTEFHRLHTLILNGNRMTELISEVFRGFDALVILYLGDNRLRSLQNGTFHHLKQLRHLHVFKNLLSDIEVGTFSGLNMLETLHLADNRLREIRSGTFRPLENLTTLFLENNLLRRLGSGVVEARQLGALYLTNNSINEIDESLNAEALLFTYLYLDGNRLQMLNSSFISILEVSAHVHLESNPWVCDCKLLPFAKWVRSSTAAANHTGLKCDSPGNLRGNSIEQVPWHHFVCSKNAFRAELCSRTDWKNAAGIHRCGRLRKSICSSSSSSSSSNGLDSCLCDPDAERCYICPEGSFGRHREIYSEFCMPCPALTTSDYGAQVSSECQCERGFEPHSSSTHPIQIDCRECPVNFYKANVGAEKCRACPTGSRSNDTASITCHCRHGYHHVPSSPSICEECPSGTYKNWTGRGECLQCPRYFVSPSGSMSVDNCTCPFNVSNGSPQFCFPPRIEHVSPRIEDRIPEDNKVAVFIVVLLGSLAGISVVFLLLYQYASHNRNKKHKVIKFNMDSILHNLNGSMSRSAENGYVCHDNWNGLMVDSKNVRFEQILGHGAFGQVHKATVTGLKNATGPTTVAIKSLREGHSLEEKDALYTELQQLVYVGHHPNIVNLLGFIFNEETLMLIIEYATHGDLLSFLRRKRMDTAYASLQFSCQSSGYTDSYTMPITSNSGRSFEAASSTEKAGSGTGLASYESTSGSDEDDTIDALGLLSIAWQVAKGMNHLAHMKCIHRDLAARNVLLTSGNVAKVSDFGLARAVYECGYYFKVTKGRLPFKWMPMEAIVNGQYTTKSDVWSFGIFLWELFTLGSNPYPGVPMNSLLDLLQSGYRMAKPNNCNQEVFEIMQKCWQERPADRPDFQELADMLEGVIQRTANLDYMQIDDNSAGVSTVTASHDGDDVSLYDQLTETISLISEVPISVDRSPRDRVGLAASPSDHRDGARAPCSPSDSSDCMAMLLAPVMRPEVAPGFTVVRPQECNSEYG